MYLLRRVERYLRSTGTPPTRSGREAVRDPRFVTDLRNGREPRAGTVARVTAYLERREMGAADATAEPGCDQRASTRHMRDVR